jgi:hypothetical protein
MSARAWAKFLCGPVQDPELAWAAQVMTERVAFTEDSLPG